ncbi:serine/threonine-protein kinase [Nocardiopsis halotolerans]
MGVVYAGVDQTGRAVAVKAVHDEYSANPEFRDRFAREVGLLRRVGGACVVPLLDADVRSRRPWLVTPLVHGPTLAEQVRRHGPLDPRLLNGLAMGVAGALTSIHQHGIAHRDLKPANVILSEQGPRVLDFGIARAVDETALTRTGSLVGTPGWISPQHYRGEPATFSDDVFAWGCLVAYAATGRPPFGTGAPDAVAFRVLQEEPDLVGFDGPLADIVRAALSKEAGNRPTAAGILTQTTGTQGTQEFGRGSGGEAATQVLTRVLDREWFPPQAPPTTVHQIRGFGERTEPKKRRTGRFPALGAGAVALLLTVSLGGWWMGTRFDQEDGAEGPDRAGARPEAAEASMPESEFGHAEYIVVQARVGPGAAPGPTAPGGPRPDGDFVVGLHPYDPEGDPDNIDPMTGQPTIDFHEHDALWGRIAEDAEILCAWSFCTQSAGGLDPHGYGTTPAEPQELIDYFEEHENSGGAPDEMWIVAEVTYTVNVNGVARITRIIETFTP